MKKILLLFFILVSSLIYAQTGNYVVENLPVNSKYNEFGTTITSGGHMLYAKIKSTKSIRKSEVYAKLYKGRVLGKGAFEKGTKFKENAISVSYSKDGKKVYYSKIVSGKLQLFRAIIGANGSWKSAEKLPFNLPNYNFKQPALNIDASLLFFVSDMPSSYGETDIYYVTIENAPSITYGIPVNLGESVNSMGVELYPFIDANDKLFFSSTDTSMGGLDIFESTSIDGMYTEKVPLRVPINSVSDDFGLTISASAESGYFSSNRVGGKGGYDIYAFKEVQLPEGACSGYIRGFIKNKESLSPVIEATVECFDPNGNATSVLTDNQGKFIVYNIDCDIRYDIVSYKEGYSFAEVQTVATKGFDLTLYLESYNQEEFEEEINLHEETTIIDTETNQVVETTPIDIEEADVETKNYTVVETIPDKGLSFAERRELNRQKKEKEKSERIAREIAEEKETLRIKKEKEAARKEAILVAERETQEREKEAQVAHAKEKAEALKLERERMVEERKEAIATAQAEAKRVRVEEVEQEEQKQAARKRAVVARRAAERKKLADERAEQIAEAQQRAAQIKIAEEERIEKERTEQKRIAEEVAEAKRVEAEKKQTLKLQQEAIEKERKLQIAEAKARAVAIKKEQEEKQRVLQEQREKAFKEAEEAIAEEQAEEKRVREAEAKERADAIRVAQEAKAVAAEAAAIQVAEAAEITKRLEQEAQAKDEEKSAMLQKQRALDLAEAKSRAETLRREQKEARALVAKKKEEERRVEEEAIADKQKEERRIRQEEAESRAEEIRIAQEANSKATEQRELLEKERQADIVAAKEKAEALRNKQVEAKRVLEEQREKEQLAVAEAKVLKQAEEQRLRNEEAVARAEKIRLAEEEKKALAEGEARKQAEEIAAAEARAEVIRAEQVVVQRELEASRQAEEERLAIEEVAAEKKRKSLEVAAAIAKADELRIAEENSAKEIENLNTEKSSSGENCTLRISGLIKDPIRNVGIANATVDMYFEGQNIESTLSDDNGVFYFKEANCNTTYTIVSYKPEIDDFAKMTVDSDNLPTGITLFLHDDEEVVSVEQEPVEQEKPIGIEIEENIQPEIEKRGEVLQNSDEPSEEEVVVVVQPEEITEAPKIINGKVDLNPIYFDLDEYYLTLSARRELDKIIVLMVQRPTMIIESGSHTDTRGPFDYNLELSEKRSQQTVGYLVANGVDPDRISGRGYGESIPLNHCVEGVRCSEREHLVNRRTEFRILRE